MTSAEKDFLHIGTSLNLVAFKFTTYMSQPLVCDELTSEICLLHILWRKWVGGGAFLRR